MPLGLDLPKRFDLCGGEFHRTPLFDWNEMAGAGGSNRFATEPPRVSAISQ
jgi:hypothetical protein